MPAKLVLLDPIGRHPAAPSERLTCSWTLEGGDAAWVYVAGELDAETAPDLERVLHGPPGLAQVVVIDLRELTTMDVSGVLAIATANVRAQQSGRRLLVLRAPPEVDRVFREVDPPVDVESLDFDPFEADARVLLQLVARNGAA